MARPIWSGSLTFGLVNLQVALYAATEDHSPHFNQFERGTSDRIRYRRVNERTGKEVDYADIVRGAAVDDGEYVLLEPEDLEDVAPGRSRSLEITNFVPAEEISPLACQKAYYLAPATDEASTPYALLREAMDRTGRVGVGTVVLRSRQYLAAIRPEKRVLVLSTLHFADEIRDPVRTVGSLPAATDADTRQLDMAEQLIESMSDDWHPERYHDTYRERVDELVAAKRSGHGVVEENEPAEATNVVDLTDALRASVAQRSGRQTGRAPERAGRRRSGDGKRTGRPPRATTSSAAGASTSRRRGSEDLSELTRAQLADRARRLDIAGRSSMRRDELEQAVDRAQRAASRRGRRRAS